MRVNRVGKSINSLARRDSAENVSQGFFRKEACLSRRTLSRGNALELAIDKTSDRSGSVLDALQQTSLGGMRLVMRKGLALKVGGNTLPTYRRIDGLQARRQRPGSRPFHDLACEASVKDKCIGEFHWPTCPESSTMQLP